MSIRLPQAATGWTTAQNGDKFGDLIRTRNLDFSKDGYLTLARKALALYSLNDSASFGQPIAITNDSNFYYIVTTVGIFEYNTLTGAMVQLNLIDAPTPGFGSDTVVFNANVVVSGNTTVNDYNPLTNFWTHTARIVTGLSSSYPHPLCLFENLIYIMVGNGNQVLMYDGNYSLIATLTIPAGYIVTGIRWRQNLAYIATRNIAGGEAKLFVWAGTFDGSANGTGATAYGVQADWIYSLCEYDSAIVVVTSTGEILRFNGGGFDEEPIAVFPVYYTPYSWISSNSAASLVGKVTNRGMVAEGKNLYINIDGSTSLGSGQFPGRTLVNQPSGLWVFKPGVGLYHRAGTMHQTHQSVLVTAVASNYIALASAVDVQLGDAVVFLSGTPLTGINIGQTYFAIPDTNQNMRLALSPADAINGDYINISGTPGGTDILHIDNYTSVGATVVVNPGPVHPIRTILPNIFFASEVLFGCTALDNTNTSTGVLMSLGMGRNVGTFTTSRIDSGALTEKWQKLFAKIEPYFRSADSFLFKYKIGRRLGMPLTMSTGMVQWTSSTTFTINRMTREFSSAAIGDDIEIIQGAGSGYVAHITNIDKSNDPTWVITIDRALTGAVNGAYFDFIVDNFTELEKEIYTSKSVSEGFFENAIAGADGDSKFLQIKCVISGYDIEMDELDVISTGSMNME